MKICVTGFGRFLDNDKNPTKMLIEKLPSEIEGNEIIALELPVIYDECFEVLKRVIKDISPDVIIMLGLAKGRNAITPERVAINLKDSKSPDNIGVIYHDEPIIKGGENAYFSTLYINDIVTKLKELELPCMISNTAGLYVCNNIFYHTMDYISSNQLNIKAGFIHFPAASKTKREKIFTMPIEKQYKALLEIIKLHLKKEGN